MALKEIEVTQRFIEQNINFSREYKNFSTIALYPVVDGGCSCGLGFRCKAAGKHPISNNWQDTPPGAKTHSSFSCYGIVTGRSSGVFVLDVDNKPGVDGLKSLENLEKIFGKLPATLTVTTPSGGAHFYFKYDARLDGVSNSTSLLGLGLDIKVNRGYVVGPGSTYRSGARYEICKDVAIAAAPEWLLEKLLAGRKPGRPTKVLDIDQLEFIRKGSAEFEERLELFKEYLGRCEAPHSGTTAYATVFAAAAEGVLFYALEPKETLHAMVSVLGPRCLNKDGSAWSEEKCVERFKDKISTALEDSYKPFDGYGKIRLKQFKADLVAAQKKVLNENALRKQAAEKKQADFVSGEYDATKFDPFNFPSPDQKTVRKIQAASIGLVLSKDQWEGVFRWDSFKGELAVVNPPFPFHKQCNGSLQPSWPALIQNWFYSEGQIASTADIKDQAKAIAERQQYNSLTEYVAGLPAMEENEANATINSFLLKLRLRSELQREMLKRHLVAAVKRALEPGFKHDILLVFFGAQGVGKTETLRELFGARNYLGDITDISSRDGKMALRGKWCVDFSELSAMSKAKIEEVKNFITGREVNYRRFAQEDNIFAARQEILFGTTNNEEFLSGNDENRRFWVVEMTEKIDWRIPNRENIWAAFKTIAAEGYPTYFEATETEASNLVKANRDQFTEMPLCYEIIRGVLETDFPEEIEPRPENEMLSRKKNLKYILTETQFKVSDLVLPLQLINPAALPLNSLAWVGRTLAPVLTRLGFEKRKSTGITKYTYVG